jgi:polyphosphate kinase 2 (PPK2 family)
MPSEKKNGDLEANDKLNRKGYERELARLHVAFVKPQMWAVHKGLKVCVLFEGRDDYKEPDYPCRLIPEVF